MSMLHSYHLINFISFHFIIISLFSLPRLISLFHSFTLFHSFIHSLYFTLFIHSLFFSRFHSITSTFFDIISLLFIPPSFIHSTSMPSVTHFHSTLFLFQIRHGWIFESIIQESIQALQIRHPKNSIQITAREGNQFRDAETFPEDSSRIMMIAMMMMIHSPSVHPSIRQRREEYNQS